MDALLLGDTSPVARRASAGSWECECLLGHSQLTDDSQGHVWHREALC